MQLSEPPTSAIILEYRATLLLYLQRRFKVSQGHARALLSCMEAGLEPGSSDARRQPWQGEPS